MVKFKMELDQEQEVIVISSDEEVDLKDKSSEATFIK